MSGAYKQLNGVDLLKFIMAFCVVAIHVMTKSVTGEEQFPFLIQWIISLAVPYFFISSGFLMCRKICNSKIEYAADSILRSRSLKLVKLFIYWLVIYLPIAFLYYKSEHSPVSFAIIDYIKMILINGESPYAWPLWFIYSMAITYFILSFFRFNRNNLILLFLFFCVVTLFISFSYENEIFKIIKYLIHRFLKGGGYLLFQEC